MELTADRGSIVALDEGRRQMQVLVVCRHPSTEAETVAGELLAARADGVAWAEMAVLVRRPGRLSRSITRTLRRHGIPVAGTDSVMVTSITAAGQTGWHTVVVAGCVEGELPHISGRAGPSDPSPASPAERRRESLAEERRLFTSACARATITLIATAAPQPAVLLSRFVEAWPRRQARLPEPPAGAPIPAQRPTDNPVAVFPDGRLVLSASQLATYVDCPLRYAYQYGLRVRQDAGGPAALGSLVHEVLAEFLRPDRDGERTGEALRAIATGRWRDDIARYRPQVEECRRDYFSMLDAWWAAVGADLPEVLAVEHRFDLEVGDVRLVGAIDRIDRTADGGIRIVDYKTGRTEPRAGSLPDDLQLAVYHLAATLDPTLAAFGPPTQLQLHYVRSMHTYHQPILADHAAATTARVLAVADHIRNERFEPSVDAACRNCTFHRLCPLQAEGREVGTPCS